MLNKGEWRREEQAPVERFLAESGNKVVERLVWAGELAPFDQVPDEEVASESWLW